MKNLRICGLWTMSSIIAFGWISVALSGAGKPLSETRTSPSNAAPPPSLNTPVDVDTRDLSEYVFLHETRNKSVSVQFAARANACRGIVRGARG